MTETERQMMRDVKSDAAIWLQRVDMSQYSYALEDTDERLLQYARLVIDHPNDHNVWELLSLKRFFLLLDRYRWKPKRVRKFFKFYEALRFNGDKARTRYKLTPIQCFQFASIFGFVDDAGKRLTRLAYLFVPRKFSKTTSASALAVYDLLLGDNNAQSYVGANSYEQAKICFNEIRAIMRDIDPSRRHFTINRESISYKNGLKDSYARCLTANARTQDGLNASLVIMDEYAQARNTKTKNGADLKNTLTSSMGARREPLTVIITTASDVLEGPFYAELQGVKKILLGEAENDTMFASLFEPDVDDAEDDPHTWAKVQPHLGITVQTDWYEKEWQNAQISAENMMTFRTKLLNIFCINEEKRWFTVEKANDLLSDFDIDKIPQGMPCVVSFDLSVHDDFSAVGYTFVDPKGPNFYSHVDCYIPEGTLAGHQNHALYKTWVEQGYLKVCKGDCIDVVQIAQDIVARSRNLNIIRFAYDAYKAQDLVNILATFGRDALKPFSQAYGSFNLPVESFEMMAYSNPRRIFLNNSPINAWCLTNCVLDVDHMNNKKPIKAGSSAGKIDCTIVTLMGIGALAQYER